MSEIGRILGHSNLGIQTISTSNGAELHLRAAQLSHLMIDTYDYYLNELSLKLHPNSGSYPGTPEDISWRVKRMQRSGPVQETGLQYIGVFALRTDGAISDETEAFKGILILEKPDGPCGEHRHTPIDIAELDIAKDLRNQKIGRALLRVAAETIHPQDSVTLDVAEPNIEAQAKYSHYGFSRDWTVEPRCLEVFQTDHIRMITSGREFRDKLGLLM